MHSYSLVLLELFQVTPSIQLYHWWSRCYTDSQGGRQIGRGPWLGNKGGTFPRWRVSSSLSRLETDSDSFKQRPCRLLSLTWRPAADWLAQQVQSWLRTCYITAVGQSSFPSFLKRTNPKSGQENSSRLSRFLMSNKKNETFPRWPECL